MSPYLISLIRTAVPGLVAWLLSLPLAQPILNALGIDTKRFTALLVVVLAFAYYAIARLLEQRVPALGALLGVPAKPTYRQAAATVEGWNKDTATAAMSYTAQP